MAKKKENSKTNTDVVGSFPKIASICSIKQCTLKKGSQDIRFENFKVSEGQTELLNSLINTGEDVQLTISVPQGQLPGM